MSIKSTNSLSILTKSNYGYRTMKKFTREEIEKKVCAIISAVIDDTVEMNELMKDDLCCDSIDCMEIVIDLEREFGIRIPDNEWDAAAGWTVSELCDYVEERTKERGLAARLEAMQKQVEEMQKQRNQQKENQK